MKDKQSFKVEHQANPWDQVEFAEKLIKETKRLENIPLDKWHGKKMYICKHHYGVMIENMTDLSIPIQPGISNGYSGIIYDGILVSVGRVCEFCENLKDGTHGA